MRTPPPPAAVTPQRRPATATPWHVRRVRGIVYAVQATIAAGLISFSWLDASSDGVALLLANQLLGLHALGSLLATLAVGPLTQVVPRIPLRGHLVRGRRAIGVSTAALVVAHATSYLAPAISRDWHEILEPGASWIVGILLGTAGGLILLGLAATSSDAAVRRLGGARWKRLHRLVYGVLAVGLAHAVLVGSDFGLRPALRGAEGDAGCLVGFSIAVAAWGVLFVLRRRGVQFHLGARDGSSHRRTKG